MKEKKPSWMSWNEPTTKNGNEKAMKQEPSVEVIVKAKRRQFSAEYKLGILAEADGCTERGEIGALVRREGLYSSHLEKWRKQGERGALKGLAGQKRGRKPDPKAMEIARLQKENEKLRSSLERAEQVIDVQKKLAKLLGTMPEEAPKNE